MPYRASPFDQGGKTPLRLVAALASATVCVALVLQLVKVLVGLVLRVACGATGARWWAALPADERDKMSGRLACSFHHAVAAGLCLSAVVHNNPQHFVWAFFWEAGFDISDSLLAAMGVGFTGMQGLPLYLHHGVALLMEVACALFGYDWYIMAQCFAILLGSGAIDLIFSKVVPKTPWQESKLLLPLLVTHFVGFVVLRLGYLSLLGYHLLVAAWSAHQPLASGLITTACAVMFTLYHLLLGSGLFSFIRAGGRPPCPPAATTTKPSSVESVDK